MLVRFMLLLAALSLVAGCASSSSSLPSSSDDVIYFDIGWHKTIRENASYYRTHERYNDSLYLIRDYYRNGKLQMEGLSRTIDPITRNDTLTFYTAYGGKYAVEPYRNGRLEGERREWYPNGQLRRVTTFRNGTREGLAATWDMSGGKMSEGVYAEGRKQGVWRSWYGADGALDSGVYDHGIRVGYWREHFVDGTLSGESDSLVAGRRGTWTWYHRNGRIAAVEHFLDDSLLDGQYWNPDGSELQDPTQAYRDPEFPGGDDAMKEFVNAHLKYPEVARRNGTEGEVEILFRIAEDGSLRDIEILRGHPELDDAALETIRSMPKWLPMRRQNRITSAYMVVPLRFQLRW